MRFFQIIFIVTCLLLPSAHSLAQDYLKLQKEAEEYYNTDDIANALAIGESALNMAEVTVGKSHMDYADILGDVAVYNAYSGNFDKAFQQVEESLALFKQLKGEKSKEYCEAEGNYATILFTSGDYIRAEQSLHKAVELTGYYYGKDSKEYAIMLGNLAVMQQMGLKKLDEAEKNLLQSKAILDKKNMQDSLDYPSMLNNLGNVYFDQGKYVQAEEHFKEAARVDRKNGRDKFMGYTTYLQNLGFCYLRMGRLDDARAIMLKELQLKKQIGGEETYQYAAALNNYSELMSELGNYPEAEAYQLRAIKIKEKTLGASHPDYITSQNNLAMIYSHLGRNEDAYALMKKVMAQVADDKISNPANYAFYASNLAVLYSGTDKNDEADRYYREVTQIYKDLYGETYGDYTEALSGWGVVMLKNNNKKQAKEYLQKALEIARKDGFGDSPDVIPILNNLSVVYQSEDNLPKAEEMMRKVVEIARDYLGERHPEYNFYLFNLALDVDQQSKNAEAEQLYAKVIETDLYNIKNNFSYLSESEKASYLTKVSVHFDSFFRFMLYVYKSNPEILSRALNYRLATKAMLLNSSGKIRNTILAGKDQQLIDAYLKWKSQKDYLVKLYSAGKRELALMKVNVDSIETAVNSLEKQLSLKTNLLTKKSAEDVSWKQIQKVLGPDEAAVEIIRTYSPNIDEQDKVFYMALIIDKNTRDYPRIAVMENGYEMETQYCKQYRDAIFDTTKKEQTYLHFWEKIGNELTGVKKVYFSADGIYPKINLNSIRNPVTKKYLIDDYDFHFVSSLRDLIEKKTETDKEVKEKSITLFGFPDYTSSVTTATSDPSLVPVEHLLERKSDGQDRSFYLDPLPGTKKEVEGIEKMMKGLGWKTETYMGKEAQELKLKSVASPRVLHIATHGYFQRDVDKNVGIATSRLGEKMTKNPLLCSGLMMAGASNAYNINYANATNWASREDGILTAFEAMNLNLDKTELVVLSACETGLGEIHNGEGVYGLQRAFAVAGAKTVVMSLWTVSDNATQKLMTLFYSRWLETGDKHGAFRYAQLELKKTFPDPYFWSAFVMIGD